MNVIYMKKIIVLCIAMIFVFIAWMPSVISQFEMKSREFSISDTITINEATSDDSTQCLDVYSWPLLDNTARVSAYSGDGYGALSHRIIRGLGVKGGEYDEIDSIRNMERIEVTFNTPQHLTFFEVRSLFARRFIDPITEEGDVDLYLGGDLVKHYDIAGVYPYGIIGRVRVTVSPTILMDKIVFYVDEDEDYSSYSEFTVAKIGVVNDDISFVIPFSGIDVVKRCLFQLDMNVLDGEADDSFDVFIDDVFVYQYIDEPPLNDSEAWNMHNINLLPFIIPSSGVHTVRINATGEQWCGQPTYGQVAVDTIELYNVNVTVHQGIRRLAYRRVDVDTLPLCCDPPVLCDSVDIGKPVSEAGHNLQEWGPIEPETHGGYYGGIDDCRVTWQSADSFRWATVDLACDVEKHSLTIGLVGSGTTDPAPGTYSYIDGTVVDLEAIPDIGWSFDHWEGGVADPNSATTTITMNDDEEVTAYFTEDQYTIDIIVDGNGTVTKNPDKQYYFYNESVNLTAVPGIGWSFNHWSGDLNGTENPTIITMDGNKAVTATFTETHIIYDLDISVVGSGTTTPSAGVHSYASGTVVDLEAFPDSCWEFVDWSGDITTTDNPTTITMDSNKAVTATFTETHIIYDLDISVVGSGTTTPSAGVHSYASGTVVDLEAFPDSCWEFVDWSGDITTTDNPTTITMDSNKAVTATFTEIYYDLTIGVVGSGTTTPAAGVHSIASGTVVDLEAFPDSGWSFSGWSGDIATTDNPTTITMDSNKAVTATFTEIYYDLTIGVVGSGTTTPSAGVYSYLCGTVVDLEAFPDSGWAFAGWSGDITTTDNPTTITMDNNKAVTATFVIPTIVSIDPSAQTVGPGETFSVDVYVEPTEAIMGATMGLLSFDHTLVQADLVTEADLFDGYLMFDDGTIDNGVGTITDVYLVATLPDAVTDPGAFVTIDFTALTALGTSDLDLDGMIIPNTSGDPLTLEVNDGTVTVEELFDLTINVVGGGTTTPSAGVHSYASGTVVDLEAFPDSCWEFAGWSGDITTTDNPTTITVDSNKAVTATFTQIYYDLDIIVVGDGSTTPAPGVYSYLCGTVVDLEAFPDPGHEFAGWSGDITTTDNPTTITMDGNKAVTATFDEIFYDLTIIVDGSGTTTPAAGVHSYAWGTVVPVEAFADVNWAFTEWTGDVPPGHETDNPVDILMDGDKTITAVFKQGWTGTLNIEASISSNNLDWVEFGESALASDGIDDMDLPKPGAPPAPYLYAWLATNLEDPYDILWHDFRFYPADEQIWDLWVETEGTGSYTTTTMTWDPADIILSGYDYVGLYEMISDNCVADMKVDSEYVYLSDHGMAQYFQIRCSNNHAPVANDDFYTTNENTQLTVTAPGVLWNDNDPEGDPISVTGVISGPSDGIVDIFADGHFVYTPNVGFSGTDTFVYEITDGEYFDTATVTIDVLTLNRISIKERWNLISMPVGEDIDRDDIIVEYLGDRYSWQEAISAHLVLGGFTYGWQGGMYDNEEMLVPGEGYWLWSYVDCDLLIPSSVPGDNHVTLLDVEWNLVGVPYGTDVSKTSLRVQFEGLWRYWDTAVNMGVILDFVYDWDRDNQYYTISDDPNTFASGFGYWVYAYHGCALKKV